MFYDSCQAIECFLFILRVRLPVSVADGVEEPGELVHWFRRESLGNQQALKLAGGHEQFTFDALFFLQGQAHLLVAVQNNCFEPSTSQQVLASFFGLQFDLAWHGFGLGDPAVKPPAS